MEIIINIAALIIVGSVVLPLVAFIVVWLLCLLVRAIESLVLGFNHLKGTIRALARKKGD